MPQFESLPPIIRDSVLPSIAIIVAALIAVRLAELFVHGLVKALMTTVLAQGPNAAVIARADRWGRVVYPLAVVANFVLAFVL